MRQVIIYGFTALHHVRITHFLKDEQISVQNVNHVINWIRDTNPDIRNIYMIDNRPGLRYDFLDAVKTRDIAAQFQFEDLVSREGLRIFSK